MADEPNKKMDETLRAYAQERRKAPELPLHPANRKMLQAEVARLYPGKPARPWIDRLRAFWPQLAFGASLCLILGFAVLSLRRPPPTEEKVSTATPALDELRVSTDSRLADLSKTDKAKKIQEGESEFDRSLANDAPVPARAVVAASSESVLQKNRITSEESLGRYSKDVTAPAQVPALEEKNALAPLPVSRREREELSDGTLVSRKEEAALALVKEPALPKRGPSDALAVKPALSPAATELSALPSVKLIRARELTNLGAARRLNFTQQTNAGRDEALLSTVTTPILRSFQVEQLGRNMRVLDRDGSVYFGAFEPRTNAPPVAAVFSRTSLAEPAPEPQNSAAFNFLVRGTNQTLGADVVLTGSYFEKTNHAPAETASSGIAPQAKQQPSTARYVIIGNAAIGSTNPVPFRAISQEP